MTDQRSSYAYSGQVRGLSKQAREALGLYRLHTQDVAPRVRAVIDHLDAVTAEFSEGYRTVVSGRRVLDVGAGQLLLHAAYFARGNPTTGIDVEVIAQGFDPRAYARMMRSNGPRRTFKTLGRKLLRIDAAYRREMVRQLGLKRFPRIPVQVMDAADLRFPDGAFDVAFCHSVLHHIPEPERAVRELTRVIGPGGVAYVSLHLWSSDTGSLDPRVMADDSSALPRWPHLRAAHEGTVVRNAYLNKLRLADWRGLFESHMPGCRIRLDTDRLAHLEPEARALRECGELADYSLEELLTRSVAITWQKPRLMA